MEGTKQVKVDNWGVFFLQRLKHFFNRTDYCDLTLQFRDYAQLKVHRLVLNACTEYFELLERTCEMYEDCLIMPDDLQADVVVPIVNFMYTGQLEYDYNLFDRLYSTASIMNMTVLTKLLDAQKTSQQQQVAPVPPPRKEITMLNETLANSSNRMNDIRNATDRFPPKKFMPGRKYGPGPGIRPDQKPRPSQSKSRMLDAPRPTRYEVPEELENEEIFESSFADISYESRPLLKATNKSEGKVRPVYDESTSSKKFEELKRSMNYNPKPQRLSSTSTSTDKGDKPIDLEQINEFAYQQKLRAEYSKTDEVSDDDNNDTFDSYHDFDRSSNHSHEGEESSKISLESGSSMTVQTKSNVDHAKIISEVLKKYPHLVKSNKNIKLKIMAAPPKKPKVEKREKLKLVQSDDESKPSYTFVTKNAMAMEKLVSLGVANTTGPWLCFICGVPGIALNFPTYNKYYRHLADVHREKIAANICEHCGYKTGKRNHLLHHLYTKHDVPPPPTHVFPKCNQCSYVALTEAFLIKHKLGHVDNKEYSCNVCSMSFKTRGLLLNHIQYTGHKISPDRKVSNQCMYCNKIFLREANLYTHLKLTHKETARKDGIIDNSDEEETYEYDDKFPSNFEYPGSPQQEHVSIKEEGDGNIRIISNINYNQVNRNQVKVLNSNYPSKKNYGAPPKKIMRLDPSVQKQPQPQSSESSFSNVDIDIADRIVVLNDNEYILQTEAEQLEIDDSTREILLSEMPEDRDNKSQDSSINTIVSTQEQPIQIVVSNDQQYEAIVTSTPHVYSANFKSSDESSSLSREVLEPKDADSVAAESSEVLVLENCEFGIAGENQEAVKLTENKIDEDPTSQSIETELAQIHGEEHAVEVVLEQDIIHETVETWQEETVIEDVNQNVETVEEPAAVNEVAELIEEIPEPLSQEEIAEEVPVDENIAEEITESENISEDIPVDENISNVVKEIPIDQNISDDQIISEEFSQSHNIPEEIMEDQNIAEDQNISEEIVENENTAEEISEDQNIAEVISEDQNIEEEIQDEALEDQNIPEEVLEDQNIQEEALEDQNIPEALEDQNIPEEALEDHSTPEEALSEDQNIAEEIAENEIISEDMNNIENSDKILTDSAVVVSEASEITITENNGHEDEAQSLSEAEILQENVTEGSKPEEMMEVEYQENSIIEESKEISKSVEEEIAMEWSDDDNTNPRNPEAAENGVSQDKDDSTADETVTEDDGAVVQGKEDESGKEKATENISNLLEEWEDNDSQSSQPRIVAEKKCVVVPKVPNIEKLVSDWDDDEDK